MSRPELVSRLDRLEAELRALEAEVTEVRRLVVAAGEPVAAAEAMRLAWAAIERGRQTEAVEHASEALKAALLTSDKRVLSEVGSFAGVVAPLVEAPLRARVDELAARA